MDENQSYFPVLNSKLIMCHHLQFEYSIDPSVNTSTPLTSITPCFDGLVTEEWFGEREDEQRPLFTLASKLSKAADAIKATNYNLTFR